MTLHMTFLLPLGLLALLTVPLIVLLHLIRQRKRRVVVPSLLHWLNVPQTRSGERFQRLPLTLLLLLHLMVATLLGLAIGRPQISSVLSGHVQQIAVVLDTSTSMATQEGGSTRFAQAQDRVRALLHGAGGSDYMSLITAGPTAQVVAAGDRSKVAAIEAILDRLEPGGTGSDLAGALTLAEASLDPTRSGRIVVLTDGATPQIKDQTVTTPVDWQIVGHYQPNRAIIAFAARPTSGSVQVYARVANYAPAPYATSLRLYRDEQRIDDRKVDIAAQSETELTWQLPAGTGILRAELDGGDNLPQDDQAILSISVSRPVNVLLVSAKPDVLQRALKAISDVKVVVVDSAGYPNAVAAQQAADLTIVDNFLPSAWPNGATLAINPPAGSSLLQVDDQPSVVDEQSLSQNGAILAGLSFGGVRFASVQHVVAPTWAQTQLAAEDVPLILRGRDGTHEIAVWAFDLTTTNLSTRLAFPLLVARTVHDLVPTVLPSSIQAGAPLTVHPSPRATKVQLIAPNGSAELFSAAPSLTFDSLFQSGWYRVVEQSDTGTLFEDRVAVNAGAALESDLQPQPPPTLTVSASESADSSRHNTADIWPWLAGAAIVFLVLEWGYTLR